MKKVSSLDFVLLLPVFFILIFSLLTIKTIPNDLFVRHLVSILVGLFFLFLIISSDYRVLLGLSLYLFILTVFLLIFVDFFGQILFGAKRWVEFGFFQIQPSELVKISLVLILSRFFVTMGERLSQFRFVLMSFAIAIIP